jgi:hypothetical protein
MGIPDGGPDRQLDADPVFGPALAGREAPAPGTGVGVTGRRRGRGTARGREEKHGMTTFTVYTVMVQEERGWRQLVAPAQRPEGACQAPADLIRDSKPLDQQSDEDHRHMQDALGLWEQDDCELTIGDRRHRLVRANLVIWPVPGAAADPPDTGAAPLAGR